MAMGDVLSPLSVLKLWHAARLYILSTEAIPSTNLLNVPFI